MPVVGIWIIDASANTVYANDQMGEILGVSPAEMMGQPSFSYVFPEDAGSAQRLFDSKRQGNLASFRFRLQRKDGSAIWVDVQGTPMHDPAGQFLGIVGTFSPVNSEAA